MTDVYKQQFKYAQAAKGLHEDLGRLEFDDVPAVAISDDEVGKEDGAFVQCWIWVGREEMVEYHDEECRFDD